MFGVNTLQKVGYGGGGTAWERILEDRLFPIVSLFEV